MKRITLMLMILILTTISYSYAQDNWSNVNFADQYKRKVKIKGKSAKVLKNNPTFINAYSINQATLMKGSKKTAKTAIHSEVSISGIDNTSYQKMVNDLYKNLVEQLAGIGMNITNGDKFIGSNYVQKRLSKDKNKDIIGPVVNTMQEGKKKITEGSMPGYGAWAVTADVTFYPEGINIYTQNKPLQMGNFYMKPASKQNTNLLSVRYYVSFAEFEGGRGYKDIKLATKPKLAVSVNVQLTTSDLKMNEISYKKMPVWGSSKWSIGVEKVKDNKSNAILFGLALSADYQIKAEADSYIQETKAIIANLQNDIVEALRS